MGCAIISYIYLICLNKYFTSKEQQAGIADINTSTGTMLVACAM